MSRAIPPIFLESLERSSDAPVMQLYRQFLHSLIKEEAFPVEACQAFALCTMPDKPDDLADCQRAVEELQIQAVAMAQQAAKVAFELTKIEGVGYFMGYAPGQAVVGLALDTTRHTTKRISGKGVEARQEIRRPIIEYAQKLARESVEGDKGKWPAGRVAGTIRYKVSQYCKENRVKIGSSFHQDNNAAQRTIKGWLLEMPDAGELFKQK